MEKIRIEVFGRAGSGKSTICKIIQDALLKEGFFAEYNEELPQSFYEPENQKCRIDHIKGSSIVRIMEVQTPR
jgi:uridine kinase